MAGTKRKVTALKSQSSGNAKKQKKGAHKAVSKDIIVPLDEGFAGKVPGNAESSVYIDDSNDIIYDASLNQTNVGNNANKFYRIQVVQHGESDFFTFCRWGRVGEFGQSMVMGPFGVAEAKKEFDKKFKLKTGLSWGDRRDEPKKAKYTFIEKNYDDETETEIKKELDSDDEEVPSVKEEKAKSKLPIQTQRLVELIFNQNHFNSVLENIGYNQEKLPLGRLGKTTLTKGFQYLKELAALIKRPARAQTQHQLSQTEAIEEFTNRYYSTIPHVFGRVRPPVIDHDAILRQEVAMLDTLSDMEVANAIMKTTSDKSGDLSSVNLIDERFTQLGMDELTPLDHNSKEFQILKDYLINTSGHTHKVQYGLQDIFRIARKGEHERFQNSAFGNWPDSCRRLLWHGSRTTNFGGILSQGLRIAPPEAPVSGYAFGKGIYLADVSTKSANYCNAKLSGGDGLLLLCEAELGNPMYEVYTSDVHADEATRKAKCIAAKAIGHIAPSAWVDAQKVNPALKGCLMPDPKKNPEDQQQDPSIYLTYNEYICYKAAQIKLRYLFRVSM